MAIISRRRKRNVIIAVIVIAVIVTLGISIEVLGTTTVEITGTILEITYTTPLHGYFGPDQMSVSGPFNVTGGAEFAQSFTVANNASVSTTPGNHTILGVYVDQRSGFVVDSVSPNLPYHLDQGASVTIKLMIRAPSHYDGPLDIELTAA